jgi:MoaA/NifB/PqqE/SkfB family radical SAM enzyme
LDGADSATDDSIRGRNTFERATATARHFTAQGIPVRISITLNQKNKGQVKALVDLATELQANHVVFAGTIPTPWNQDLVLGDDDSMAIFAQLQELQETERIEIRNVSSLHACGGVSFCGNLAMRELAFEPSGEMRFCCDTTGRGAIVGSLFDQPLSKLIEAWLRIATDLQIERARCIAAGQMGEGFDTCTFCNEHFARRCENH